MVEEALQCRTLSTPTAAATAVGGVGAAVGTGPPCDASCIAILYKDVGTAPLPLVFTRLTPAATGACAKTLLPSATTQAVVAVNLCGDGDDGDSLPSLLPVHFDVFMVLPEGHHEHLPPVCAPEVQLTTTHGARPVHGAVHWVWAGAADTLRDTLTLPVRIESSAVKSATRIRMIVGNHHVYWSQCVAIQGTPPTSWKAKAIEWAYLATEAARPHGWATVRLASRGTASRSAVEPFEVLSGVSPDTHAYVVPSGPWPVPPLRVLLSPSSSPTAATTAATMLNVCSPPDSVGILDALTTLAPSPAPKFKKRARSHNPAADHATYAAAAAAAAAFTASVATPSSVPRQAPVQDPPLHQLEAAVQQLRGELAGAHQAIGTLQAQVRALGQQVLSLASATWTQPAALMTSTVPPQLPMPPLPVPMPTLPMPTMATAPLAATRSNASDIVYHMPNPVSALGVSTPLLRQYPLQRPV